MNPAITFLHLSGFSLLLTGITRCLPGLPAIDIALKYPMLLKYAWITLLSSVTGI
jgi:hypothetical protein